ncbi:TPA: hypothetical protein N0F65_011366 [Lagenidium giganteum]|uniref:AB hydrolase-1 domain-containing protein n=1 Tax=Lagenidium giganteum TaxID=4803 RepID=A0AAV2ZAH2_9STRA|nr:TPA: hypothetical protein N0F65_011366 [Lagenidium giganteum]
MRLSSVAVALCSSILVAGDSVQSYGPKQTQWFPCGFSVPVPGQTVDFQCAQFDVPLCHNGVCSSNQRIKLFVKRLLATTDSNNQPNLWMIQGGPGYSSAALEPAMVQQYLQLNGRINMYTVDHRGTGRSSFLECEAAQSMTAGSIGGVELVESELIDCFTDVLGWIDNKPEAFSITSAAKDVEYLIGKLTTKAATYVYGLSYGTLLVERVMHLAPKGVKGYILDSAMAEKNAVMAQRNQKMKPVGIRYAQACEDDSYCRGKFTTQIEKYGTLHAAFLAILDNLDTAFPGQNACADWVQSLIRADPSYNTTSVERHPTPSAFVKNYFALLASSGKQYFIPALFNRLNRCNEKDLAFLQTRAFAANFTPDPTAPTIDRINQESPLLAHLIVTSEFWTGPVPTVDELDASRPESVLHFNLANELGMYCLYTGWYNEPACQDKAFDSIKPLYNVTPAFVYQPDQYSFKAAIIPDGAGVLMLAGGFDMLTPIEVCKQEFNDLKGGNKALVEFPYGPHMVGVVPATPEDTTMCGYQIMASFVQNNGIASKIDRSCLSCVPKIQFNNVTTAQRTFGADLDGDVFEGTIRL